MIDQSKVGTDWQADELDAIVATYFAMLAAELAGRPYVKAHHARDLMARTGRSHRAVEFKHMNLSSVLAALGLPTIRGYRRMDNIQNALFPAVERYLDAHPNAWSLGLSSSSPWQGEGGREAAQGSAPRQPSVHEPDQPFASPWSQPDAPPVILSNTAPPPPRPAPGATEASESDQGGQGRARQRRPVGGPAGVVVSMQGSSAQPASIRRTPACRQLGRNPVKPGIGLIQQGFCPDTRDQNGPPPIFTSIKIGRRVKMR